MIGDIHDALTTAKTIADAGYQDSALNHIAEAQAVIGDVQGALTTAKMISKTDARYDALANTARTLADNRKLHDAMAIAEKIDSYRRSTVLVRIAKAKAKAGNRRDAAATLSKALAVTEVVEDPARRARALLSVANAQAESGSVEDAKETFSLVLLAVGRVDKDETKVDILSSLAKGQADAGDKQAAERSLSSANSIVTRVKQKGLALQFMFGDIAIAQSQIGKFDEAVATAERIGNHDWQVYVLTRIVAVGDKR